MKIGATGAGAIAGGLICILAFLTWALIYRSIPAENKEALTVLLGVLSANIGIVVGYYFGSTNHSRAKDQAIAHLAAGQSNQGQP